MRFALYLVLSLFGAVAGSTLAFGYPEEELQTPAFTIDWESRPTGIDMQRHYPSAAAEAGQSGVVVMCCTVNPDGTLSCGSAFEAPTDVGFDVAALRLSRRFRMKPADAATWSASGDILRVPVWFLINVTLSSRRVQEWQARVFEATRFICHSPIS